MPPENIPDVKKKLHWLMIGKPLLPIGKNPSKVKCWQKSKAHLKNSLGIYKRGEGAVPRKYCTFYTHLSLENTFPPLKKTQNLTYIWTIFFLENQQFNHKLTHPLLNKYHDWKINSTVWKNMKGGGLW